MLRIDYKCVKVQVVRRILQWPEKVIHTKLVAVNMVRSSQIPDVF